MGKRDCEIVKPMPRGMGICSRKTYSSCSCVKGDGWYFLDGLCRHGKAGSDTSLIFSWLSAITERPSGAISTIELTDGGIPITSQPGGPPWNRNSYPPASLFVRQGLFVGFRYMHRAG